MFWKSSRFVGKLNAVLMLIVWNNYWCNIYWKCTFSKHGYVGWRDRGTEMDTWLVKPSLNGGTETLVHQGSQLVINDQKWICPASCYTGLRVLFKRILPQISGIWQNLVTERTLDRSCPGPPGTVRWGPGQTPSLSLDPTPITTHGMALRCTWPLCLT